MVEPGMEEHCDDESRHEVRRPGVHRALDSSQAHHREQRGRSAVHERGAEAAHDPGAHARLGSEVQVVQVLGQREARADGEAVDRRVDEEADAVHAYQCEDDQALEQLFGQRRDVAREREQADVESAEQEGVQRIAHHRHHGADADHRDDGRRREQLVAVEPEQRRQEDDYRQQRDERRGQLLYQHFGALTGS